MAEDERDEVTQIRDPKTGKLLARVDHSRDEVELRAYRGRAVWVPLSKFIDKRDKRR